MLEKWQSSRPDQMDKLMKGSAHSSGSVAGLWNASQAACSADALSISVMVKAGMSSELLSVREMSFSAWAISSF